MTDTYDSLRQRMLDGDTTITAAQLDKARRDDDYEQLQAEAADAAADREATAQRERDIATLREDVAAFDDTGFADMQLQYETAFNALRTLRQAMTAWNQQVGTLQRRAAILGVDDLTIPAELNGPFELDRLERDARSDHEPTEPHSRLYTGGQ